MSCLVSPRFNRDSDRANLLLEVLPTAQKRDPLPDILCQCIIILPWSPFQRSTLNLVVIQRHNLKLDSINHLIELAVTVLFWHLKICGVRKEAVLSA